MNVNQRAAFEAVMGSVENKEGKLFFISGPAGTGKTFCYKTLCHAICSQGKIVLCVASSGIAALLLRGGRTAHSMFKIPIDIKENSTCNISPQSQLAEVIRQTDLIIWDEIPMQHRYCAEAVNRTLQDIFKLKEEDDTQFGKITVVFGGDFQQILPVVKKGSRADIIGASLLRSPLWRKAVKLKLTQNMRLGMDAENREYAEWLQRVGKGEDTAEDGSILLDESMKCGDTIDSLIDQIYPAISENDMPSDEFFLNRTILCPLNDEVNSLNDSILQKFPGTEFRYNSADKLHTEEGVDATDQSSFYPVEFLNTISHSGLPSSKLILKKGVPLMLLRNLDPQKGLCNGTRCVLINCTTRVLQVRVLGGDISDEDRVAFIPRITLFGPEEDLGFKFSRRQFPVRLAFAMTINKSQGQSLKYVGINLHTPVFTHGQLYVALSRCTSKCNVKVLFQEHSDTTVTKNFVYSEVFDFM
jgi:ATP-dependent exoDNAse (exonuclease V) alpha subunit